MGNHDAAHVLNADFRVTALDSKVEYGGLTLAAEDSALLSCLNERLDRLNDKRTIGNGE